MFIISCSAHPWGRGALFESNKNWGKKSKRGGEGLYLVGKYTPLQKAQNNGLENQGDTLSFRLMGRKSNIL